MAQEFPPNSRKAAQRQDREPVKRVTSVAATRRRKPLGKQLHETFIGGDARSATQHVLFNVLIPAAKDALVEAGVSGIEKLIYGEARGRRPTSRASGELGRIAYNRMTAPPTAPGPVARTQSRRARQTLDFSEILLESRVDAEMVLDSMYDVLSKYEAVSVADLNDLVGLPTTHIDRTWGWTDLGGTEIVRTRSGAYALDLPEAQPLRG